MGGTRKTYNSRAEPRAAGVEVAFDYPASWRSTVAKRPNTLAQVTSRHGRGLELCNLLLKPLDLPTGYMPTPREIDEMLDEGFQRSIVPSGANYITSKRVKIDGQPGAAVRFSMIADQAGISIASQWVSYVFYFDKRLIFFSCSVGDEGSIAPIKLARRFKEYFPLFQQMASSIVIHSRWKRP